MTVLREDHWWVMDRSCDMLGCFGNEGAVETLRFMRDRLGHPESRLDAVLDPANALLTGPPKPVLPGTK